MSAKGGKTLDDEEYEEHWKEWNKRHKWKWRALVLPKKRLHPKHKRKLTLLLGYQLSNLGWIGAWIAATDYGLESVAFFLCVTLICIADTLILLKEYE